MLEILLFFRLFVFPNARFIVFIFKHQTNHLILLKNEGYIRLLFKLDERQNNNITNKQGRNCRHSVLSGLFYNFFVAYFPVFHFFAGLDIVLEIRRNLAVEHRIILEVHELGHVA